MDKDMADHGKVSAGVAVADEKRWKQAWQRMNKKPWRSSAGTAPAATCTTRTT